MYRSNKFDVIRVDVISGVKKMITDEINQMVMTRYGKFAETGGNLEAC